MPHHERQPTPLQSPTTPQETLYPEATPTEKQSNISETITVSQPASFQEENKSNETNSFTTSFSLDTNLFSSLPTFQQQVVFSQANLLGKGDNLSVGYIHTEQANNWDIRYTLPINTRDGTLTLAYSQGNSNTLNLPFENIDEIGNHSNIALASRSYELTLRQPIIRSIKPPKHQQQEQPPTSKELALGLTTSLNDDGLARIFALRFFQEWKKQSALERIEFRSQFSFGINAFNSTINAPTAEINQIPNATFFSWQGQAEWSRFLAKDTLLQVRANAQLTNRSLMPLEQFVLGGKGSVRGYSQDIFLTDNGIFASAEVQLPILHISGGKGLIQVVPFVDFGMVWNSSGQANPTPNTLAAFGLGLQWQQGNFTARLDWGIPLIFLDTKDKIGQEKGLYLSVQYHL